MRCIIQFIGQGVGLILLHRRWGSERLPFRMWLYPLPVMVAIIGWMGIFISTGRTPMLASLGCGNGRNSCIFRARAMACASGLLRRSPDAWNGQHEGFRRWPRSISAASGVALAARLARLRRRRLRTRLQAIKKARVPTRILYVTAHPDDETAGLLAYLSRGLYADVADSDDHARTGRPECDRARAGWAAGRDPHDGIAGGGFALRRASIFYARGGYRASRKAPSEP